MNSGVRLRWATDADNDQLGRVVFDAVRTGHSPYSEEQRAAWVPTPRSGREWNERLATQDVLVAETGTQIVGFMTLSSDGYLDLAHILPSHRGTGLFRQLYEMLEARAIKIGCARISLVASLMAAPAFGKVGFHCVRQRTVRSGDHLFACSDMEKVLFRSSNRPAD